MGDEDDRGAGVGLLPEGGEEGRRLVGGEDGRRLVEDEDVRLAGERARDLDALARAHGQRVHAVAGAAELEAERLREPRDARPARPRALDEGRVPVEKGEVVRDARGSDEEVVLRHEREARVARVLRPREPDGPAAAQDLAGVGREAAGGDRDERRLAGPVLAEKGVDLSGEDREICF